MSWQPTKPSDVSIPRGTCRAAGQLSPFAFQTRSMIGSGLCTSHNEVRGETTEGTRPRPASPRSRPVLSSTRETHGFPGDQVPFKLSDGGVLGHGGRRPFQIVNEPPGIHRGEAREQLNDARRFVCIRMGDGNDPVKHLDDIQHLTGLFYAHVYRSPVPPGLSPGLVDGLPRSGSDPGQSGDNPPRSPGGSPLRGGRSVRQGRRPRKRASLPHRWGTSSRIGTGDPALGADRPSHGASSSPQGGMTPPPRGTARPSGRASHSCQCLQPR